MKRLTVYKRLRLRHNPPVRRAPSLAASLAVVVVASSAFGSGLPEPGIWIPANASFVAFADLGTLLSSPALEGLEALLEEQISADQIDNFRELTGMDPFRDFHAVTFFTALESVEVETTDDRVEVSFEVDGRSLRDWLRERAKATSPKNTARPPS